MPQTHFFFLGKQKIPPFHPDFPCNFSDNTEYSMIFCKVPKIMKSLGRGHTLAHLRWAVNELTKPGDGKIISLSEYLSYK